MVKRADFMTTDGDNLLESPLLYYVDGYKYQTRNDMVFQTYVFPQKDIVTELIILRTDGWMWVGKYFAWDGCSGPTLDDSTNMRAGLCHDALYALHRMGLLDIGHRLQCDDALYRIMIEDGAAQFRARYYRWAVNHFAAGSADPKSVRVIRVAPKRINLPGTSPA